MELIHLSESSRVFRLPLSGLVCKEPLGSDAQQRISWETDVLSRLAAVEGVARLAAAGAGSIMLHMHDGGTALADVLKQGRVATDDVIAISTQLARTLSEVHRVGVIHRDISPANILLRQHRPTHAGARYIATLIDFDQAVSVDFALNQSPAQARPVGTPGYAAPELSGRTARGVDQRADLYALGATMYEMAAGRPQFERSDALRLMHDNLVRDPTPPASIDASIPQTLSDIIIRLLAKEPQDRYQSAEGLLHDLHRLQALHETAPGQGFTLGANDFPARLQAPHELVGRDEELGLLRSALSAAMSTASHSLLIEGTPGVGKSALIHALKPAVTAAGGWFLYGKFDQYQKEASTASADRQAVAALSHLLLALPEEKLSAQRTKILDRLAPNAGLVARALPEFAVLLGDQPEPAALDPRQSEQRLLQCMVDMLGAVASPERPLVFAMDDLQWASELSLRMLDLMMSERSLRGLLVVGAFRSSEVDESPSLRAWLSKLAARHDAPPRLTVKQLNETGVARLAARMLRLPWDRAQDIGQPLAHITAGNPFNIVEMVNALRGEGILQLGQGGWHWDPDAIRGFILKGNVIDLLMARVARLTPVPVTVLETMSCLGSGVDLGVLQIATGLHGAQLREALLAPARQGMVTVDEEGRGAVHFRHDFVQQAVMARMDADIRARMQLGLARRLARDPACVLQAAHQYSACTMLLEEPAERLATARLFLATSATLMHAADFSVAERYLAAASRLLVSFSQASQVQSNGALGHAVNVQWHLALYCLGRLEDADAPFAEIQCRTPDPLTLVESTCIQMRSLDYRGRMRDSLRLGEELLARLGVEVPRDYEDPRLDEHVAALGPWLAHESRLSPGQWVQLRDPHQFGVARLLARMVRSAYFLTDVRAFLWLLLKSQRQWAEHGHSAPVAAVLGRIGIALCGMRQDYRTSYDIARHVLNVSEAARWEPETSEARFLFSSYFQHWRAPLEQCLPQILKARDGVKASGDVPFSSYMGLSACAARFDCFPALDAVEAEIAEDLVISRKAGHAHSQAMLQMHMRLVHLLRDTPIAAGAPRIDFYDVAQIAGIEKLPMVQLVFDDTRSIAAAIMGDLAAIAHYVRTAIPLADPANNLACLPGHYMNTVAYLVLALLRAEQARTEPGVELPGRLADLAAYREWFQRRAADEPVNHRHLFHLIDAEQAWALGQIARACAAYEAAHSAARSGHRPWHRALITERAARFQLALGMRHTGLLLLAEARDVYEAWGAMAKVRRLEQEYPDLRAVPQAPGPPAPRGVHSHSERSADALDLMGVLRASQALSSETSMQRLSDRVGEVLASLTGATRVTLLSKVEGRWSLLAEAEGGEPARPTDIGEAAGPPAAVCLQLRRTHGPGPAHRRHGRGRPLCA